MGRRRVYARGPMSGSIGRRARAVTCAVALSAAGSTAFAQTDTDALRRDLVAQAERAREAGDHAQAAELAGRAAALRMTPSLALLLAQEHEQLGHFVTALDHARRCTADATADTALRNRERIMGICRELTEVLSRRVGRLTVRVAPGLSRATVTVGGRELPTAAWGVAVPVDPGEVAVRVSDEALHHAQTVTVRVAAGANAEVALEAPAAVAGAEVRPVQVPAQATVAVTARVTPPPGEGPVRRGTGAGPWVLAGVGAAAFVGAGVLWGLHGAAMDERDGACDAGGCDPSSVDADERMRGFTTGTNIAIGVGSAAVAGGVVWFLVARASGGRAEEGRPTAWVVPTGNGIAMGGTL